MTTNEITPDTDAAVSSSVKLNVSSCGSQFVGESPTSSFLHKNNHENNLKNETSPIENTSAEIALLQNEILKLQKKVALKEADIEKLQRQYDKLENDFRDLSVVMQDMDEDVKKLEQSKITLLKRVEVQKEDMKSLSETIRILQQDCLSSESLISALRREIDSLTSDRNNLNSLIRDLENRAAATYTSNKVFFGMLAIIVFLVAVMVASFFSPSQAPTPRNHPLSTPGLSSLLRKELANQNERFYGQVITSYTESIVRNKDPSVIMLVTDKRRSRNAKCVAGKILRLLNDAANGQGLLNPQVLVVDTQRLKNTDNEYAKEELNKDLVNIFTNLNSKVALVDGIQNIPAKSALLFHSYGDIDEAARYRGVILILTYETSGFISDDDAQNADTAKLTQSVEKALTEDWTKLDYDQLRPLFARITNTVIIPNHEETCQ